MAPTTMKLRVRRNNNSNSGEQAPEIVESTRASRRRKKIDSASRSAARTPPVPSEEASPDSKCPICLDRFNNMAYLDRCLHRFCFPCIQEWSHNKAECPLCKQPFASILHSVRAEDDFKEYTLRPAPTGGSVAATVAMVAAMASAARSDHQLRLMLRRHRVADAAEPEPAARSRSRGRGGAGRSREEHGVWEWYLDVPPLPVAPPRSDEDVEAGLRDGADPDDRGVVFEGLSGLGQAAASRASRRLVARLGARLRLQREGSAAARRLRAGEMVTFRRALYRGGIRARGVAGVGATRPQRDVSADGFRRDPGQLDRLRPWLRRELTALYGAHGSVVDMVQRVVAARSARRGLEDAAALEEELQPYLLGQTEHFVHELLCFARSPLGLDEYDLHAAYQPPPPPPDSGGSASSSVIAISEEEEEEEGEGRRRSGTQQTSVAMAVPASPSPSPLPQEDEEGECMIVGYKKPMAERTPELVHLSSDSERSSPPVPPSTSAACQEKEPPAGPTTTATSADVEKKNKRRRRSRDRPRKSGTLANPNRSIYPAMMRSFSYSSLDSGSPLALSPPADCGWELSSSLSSSSLCSFSSVCSSSPPPSPPLPSRLSGEKPGGKRKYKSRHLDECSHPSRRRRERGRGKRKGNTRKVAAASDSTGERQRSPSVEIVYEGTVPPKRNRKTQLHGRAPPVITLDSDSEDEPAAGPSERTRVPADAPEPVCQVGGAPPPLARAPSSPLQLQDEGTGEEESHFMPVSPSLDFLSHAADLFQGGAADLSAPPSPSIMSCPL